ncbi:putative chromatin binding protein [Trypanosoma rangeli]|uniref:Putative chromatin binding protein n=1 Tax=Trypanosoma rangeli TaxID=5698 RepID=A0A3S5ISC4_TRYRA|nr:putative chromatin binding protein [Trypanosoma rangeli]RNF10614.1 putative chromatin binding protein [Trypanosoma rangeli]|eukprot:RNF10614.1 putative chromatin binding protein [Trypanosoma rangeli]
MEEPSRNQHDPAAHTPSTHVVIAVCGCGNDGRLGLGTLESKSRITLVPFFLGTVLREGHNNAADMNGSGEPLGTILAVRVGGYHNFAITTTGVYGWGLNEHGQLGLGRGSASSVPLPTRIPFFDEETVIDIQCGAYHTFAWTKKGLFVCGKNSDGQLGLLDEGDHLSFTTLLTAAQANNSNVRESDEIGECRLIQQGQLTHVSCGTHHTLLAFRDVVVVREDNGEVQRQQAPPPKCYPLLIAAAGKGDFGELGYDGDAWSVLQAKTKTMQYALSHGLQKQQEETDSDARIRICMEKKWKAVKPRRALFSSLHFQPVLFPILLDQMVAPPATCYREILSLHAMHLHSAAILRERTYTENQSGNAGRIRTFHWGCYYCNVPEDDASSIPREDEKEGVFLHAGNETLFRYTTTPPAEVEVMGSGMLGLGEEDSLVTSWTPLPLPHGAKNLCIRAITGREHYLILLENTLVVGFGDNMHGQLGVGESQDVVLCPTVLLRTGDEMETATPFAGGCRWKVQSIRDAACGVRHSVYLVEICCLSTTDVTSAPQA